jgi:hypothetical protein
MHGENWAKSECMHHVFKESHDEWNWKDDQLHWHMNIERCDYLYVRLEIMDLQSEWICGYDMTQKFVK